MVQKLEDEAVEKSALSQLNPICVTNVMHISLQNLADEMDVKRANIK